MAALNACVVDPRAGLDDDLDGSSSPDARIPAADMRVSAPDAGPDVPPCAVALDLQWTNGFEAHEPFVAEGRVFAHRRGPGGQLRAVDLLNDAPVGGPMDLLLDARGAARLLARPDGAGAYRLIYRADARDTVLSESERWAGWLYGEGTRRMVEPGGAAWVENDAIHALCDGRVGPIWLGPAHGIGLSEGDIVYVKTLEFKVYFAPPDGEERPIGPAEDTRAVVPSRGHVWWISGGRPFHGQRGEAQGRAVSDLQNCDELDADGGRGLVVCRPDPQNMTVSLITAAGQVTELDRAPLLMSPRAGHGALAWARYEDPDAWCANASDGVVKWQPPGAPEPLEAGPATSGCLCCGAWWAPLQIALGDHLVAWNYGSSRADPAIAIAIARCR